MNAVIYFQKKNNSCKSAKTSNRISKTTNIFLVFFVCGIGLPQSSLAYSFLSAPTYSVFRNASDEVRETFSVSRDADLVFVQQGSSLFSVQDIKGKTGATIPIKITISPEITKSEQQIPKSAYVTLRGLPEDFKISTGLSTKKSWVVSLADLQHLSLISSSSYKGSFPLDITLYWGEAAPQTKTITVNIGEAAVAQADVVNSTASNVAASPSDDLEPKAAVSSVNEVEETRLLQRAQQLMNGGNVAAARMIYEALALRGSASGALAMGRSFDPASFKTIVVVGLKPDIEQARKWYEIAKKLGSNMAEERLTALNSTK
jgi:hypothetical protein